MIVYRNISDEEWARYKSAEMYMNSLIAGVRRGGIERFRLKLPMHCKSLLFGDDDHLGKPWMYCWRGVPVVFR